MTRFALAALLLAGFVFAAQAQTATTTTKTTATTTKTTEAAGLTPVTGKVVSSLAPQLAGRDLAKAVANVMPLDQQVNDFTNSMAGTLPADKQAVFKGIMKKNIDIVKLREAAVDALLKTYTERELRLMHNFYAQPESQAIMNKLSTFGTAMQPTVEVMLTKAVAESQKAGIFPSN